MSPTPPSPTQSSQQQTGKLSETRVVKIDLSEELILSTDENGLEAYRFTFQAKDRETGEIREVRLLEPCWNDWNAFVRAAGDVFVLLAADLGPAFAKQWQPEALEELTEGDDFRIWAYRTQAMLSIQQVQEQVRKVLDYLHVEIDGIDNEYETLKGEITDIRTGLAEIRNLPKVRARQLEARLRRLEARAGNSGPKAWLMQNVGVVVLTRVFALLLDLPNAVKKNAISVLTHIFQMEISSPSGNSSPNTSESQPTQQDGLELLKPSRFFDA